MTGEDTNIIPAKYTAIIEAQKRIEYKYAKPYMDPEGRKPAEDEAAFRERVRNAIMELPKKKRENLKEDKLQEFNQLADEIKLREDD